MLVIIITMINSLLSMHTFRKWVWMSKPAMTAVPPDREMSPVSIPNVVVLPAPERERGMKLVSV